MAYETRTTAEFDACLEEAVTYRLDNYGRNSARRLLDAVDTAGELLVENPFLGATVDVGEQRSSLDSLRWVRMDSYIAVCRVEEKSQVAYLLKLFHESSNWRRRISH